MSSAFVAILLLAAQPSTGCCASVDHGQGKMGLFAGVKRQVGYHKRLYYGHFDRHPFDYRFQFDVPWQAGPSQAHWPIAPLPAAAIGPWQAGEFEAPRTSTPSPRVSIASEPAWTAEKPAANRTTLKLRVPAEAQQ
jgi:hypothetical protein